MNNIPKPIDKAVEKAQNMKKSYNNFFEDELLTQIAIFLDDCNYHTLSSINNQSIGIGRELTTTNSRTTTTAVKVYVGNYPIYIDSVDNLLVDNDNISDLSLKDVYFGLGEALERIIVRILSGDNIPGFKVRKRLFGRYNLILSL